MSITTSFFIWIIETAKILKKEPFWGQTPWNRVGQKNQKMVLTNIVQDANLYLKMNYQHILQKIPIPYFRSLYGVFKRFGSRDAT